MYIPNAGRARAAIDRVVRVAHKCEYCGDLYATRHSISHEAYSDKSVILDPEGARAQAVERVEHLFGSSVGLARTYVEIRCPRCGKLPSNVLADIEASCRSGVPTLGWFGLGFLVLVGLGQHTPGRGFLEPFQGPLAIPMVCLVAWIGFRWWKSKTWSEEFQRRLTDIPDAETEPLVPQAYEAINRHGYELLADRYS
jgi:predicted RNA-binding Zn-ribbon protein involved in translation (DUF1610 family)